MTMTSAGPEHDGKTARHAGIAMENSGIAMENSGIDMERGLKAPVACSRAAGVWLAGP